MSLTFEGIVNGLVAAGVPRAAAEARARQEHGLPSPVESAKNARDARILEKAEQSAIIRLFRAWGFRVWTLSQPRATKQSPGIADLWCAHTVVPVALWWESKRQVGGVRSEDQVEFGDFAERCRVGYGFGDRHDVATWLRRSTPLQDWMEAQGRL